MNLLEQLEALRATVIEQLQSGTDPEALRISVLGRKGELASLMRSLGGLPLEEKQAYGSKANALKKEIEALFKDEVSGSATVFLADRTVPALDAQRGSIHPITAMIDELTSIFEGLSFEIVEGNELVTDWDNFGSLNFHADHPARDNHDTFYVNGTDQLRTHTSSVQVAEMKRRFEAGRVPMRFVVPGKTYRRDSDATHSAMFHQLEGVIVDTQTTFADLKGVLDYVARRLFGDAIETRFRTHYFPFTEPSAEIDIRSKDTDGKGTPGKWIEMLGCGMIHPKVLENAGINHKVYQGWAFGMGIERPIFIRRNLPDLRLFFENTVPFLDQFEETV